MNHYTMIRCLFGQIPRSWYSLYATIMYLKIHERLANLSIKRISAKGQTVAITSDVRQL